MEENVYPVIMISGPDGKAIAESFLQKNIITIGRGDENDIALLDPDMKVSRVHVRLEKKGNDVYLYDLNSRNGTLYNGEKLEGEPSCVKLKTEDEVHIGSYIMRLYVSVATSNASQIDQKITEAETLEHDVERPSYPLVAQEIAPVVSPSARVRREKLAKLVIEDEHSQRRSFSLFTPAKIILLLLIVSAGIGWHLGWWQKFFTRVPLDQGKQQQGSTGIAVTVLKIESLANDNVVLESSGYVTVRRRASVEAPIEGEVDKITVSEGQEVKCSQILARFKQSRAQVTLDLSRTKLESARKKMNEIERKLHSAKRVLKNKQDQYNKNLISKMELNEARDQYSLLRAQKKSHKEAIKSARQQLKMTKLEYENTLIKAPFDGQITRKFCEVGEICKKGERLFTIIDRVGIGATIDVNEIHLSKVFLKQKVTLTLHAYEKRKYEGKVRRINPEVDKQKGTVSVDVVFADADDLIRPGMGVRAAFKPESTIKSTVRSRILVPANAIYDEDGKKFLWIASGNSAEKRTVSTGKSFEEQVEIIAGIGPGERVIITCEEELWEGAQIYEKN